MRLCEEACETVVVVEGQRAVLAVLVSSSPELRLHSENDNPNMLFFRCASS